MSCSLPRRIARLLFVFTCMCPFGGNLSRTN
jgi:hypothetical protein